MRLPDIDEAARPVGNPDQAAETLRNCDSIIALRPQDAEMHFDRGNALRDLQRPEEALQSFKQAITLNPHYAEAYNGLATVLHRLERSTEAFENYSHAIGLRPDFAEAYLNMARLLRDRGRPDLAIEVYDRLIGVKPDFAPAHNSKGATLQQLRRYDEALESHDRAVVLQQDFATAHNDRSVALQRLERYEEALQSCEKAITLNPDYADAYNNKGNALRELNRQQEAIQCFDSAIALKPDLAEAHFNKSSCLLLSGDWETGWELYEWRKRMAAKAGVWNSVKPEWNGRQSLDGRVLFVHAEQGLGDTIQFSRYALLAQRQGAKVILGVQDGLVRLLGSLGHGVEIVPLTRSPEAIDYHIALMSLPLALRASPGAFQVPVPYLRAEPDRVSKWKQRIGSDGFKIGICWQGSKQSEIDVGRSFAVRHFADLAKHAGVRLISLQKGDGVEQLADLLPGMRVEMLGDFDVGPDAFIDSAAVMECLDLVITCDTAIAHLAGALARPTWVALKYVPDWRWLLDRSDSPWYPTMRLFRQAAPGDWTSVFAAINAFLVAEISGTPQNTGGRHEAPADATNMCQFHSGLVCSGDLAMRSPITSEAHPTETI